MSVRIRPVIPEFIDAVWPDALPYLEKALEHSNGWWTSSAILRRVMGHDMQMYVGTPADSTEIIGVMVTQILVSDEGRKALNIVALSAEAFEPFVEAGHEMLNAWGNALGADRLLMTGRPGWKGLLKNHGWEMLGVQMMKECRNA
jgi:hypothetical protein